MGAGDITYTANEKKWIQIPEKLEDEGVSIWGYYISPIWGFIAYVDGGYQIQFRPLKKVASVVDDVPLCTLDEVISSVEKQIEKGNLPMSTQR